jgi:DNA-binding CsgD family transcriptional regulator
MLKNGVGTEFDFTSAEAIERRPYYQEFLAPFGLRWFACVKVTSGHDVFFLSLQRTIQQGPFLPEEIVSLGNLSGRLAGAGAMAAAFGFARAESALEAFQASGTAVLLMNRLGHVFRANAAAEALLGDDLQIRNRRLTARNSDDSAAIDQALHSLLWRTSEPCLVTPVVLRRDGMRPLIAYPLRLDSLARDVVAPAFAAIVLVDLAQRVVPAENVLRQIFGLTGAEARLAARIAGGATVSEAADVLGITYDTARGQLKGVFAKTQTGRQAELIALMARLSSPPGRAGQ